MRLSMDDEDLGYDPFNAIRAKVYLNGDLLIGCLTADEELGEVTEFVFNGPNFSISSNDKPITETRRGAVKIVLEP